MNMELGQGTKGGLGLVLTNGSRSSSATVSGGVMAVWIVESSRFGIGSTRLRT